ncbi:MAG: hypothetical protein BM557_08785 [Flavobacterium sp. MedPE-SWcel]|uniref:DUF4129 domain-containing protein n=1 Tax=uncultured Flavobacterium sp. TaxID=165435 RepID=UPI00091EF297|nr:DUF4129 domain-containing protein [uncultured Flavobacterium sp.]OIQ17330.1 MAG: hypothetical protein BM557_08785 [Flavobacterium sp. MedPE-SWcel]
MNKILLYLLLLATPLLYAIPVQDTTSVEVVNTITPITNIDTTYVERKFEDNFKNRYTDEDFVYEPKNEAQSSWDRFWEAIAEFFSSNQHASNESSGVGIGKIILYILAGAVVIFAVYMIVRAIIDKESKWIFGKSKKSINNIQDITEQSLHKIDFKKQISKTKNSEDYRAAIRYYYLWLLQRLSDREIIDWHPDKTNSDYSYEIKDSNLKKEFDYLSYVYDYSWYGEFTIEKVAFEKAEKRFNQTLNTL